MIAGMFQIDVEITADTDRSFKDWQDDTFLPAVVDALNETAEAARDHVVEAMSTYIDRPMERLARTLRVGKAKAIPGRVPDALLFAVDTSAGVWERLTVGGVRRAGDPGTTRLGPLVPGRAAQLNRYGSLPRNFVSKAMQDPHVSWVTLRPGEPPALVRNAPGKRIEVLAVIARETHYRPDQLPLYDLVEQAVEQRFEDALARALTSRKAASTS